MVDIMSGEVKDTISPKKRAPASRRGHAGGVKGGKARADKLTAEQRATIAKQAASARWKSKTT